MFVPHWDDIQDLRAVLKAESEVLLNPLHFLASTDDTRRSCSVAVWRDDRLIGLLYATQHYIKGFASGYAVGGDFSGRGLLLCSPDDESSVLAEGIRRMTARGVHSLHLRFLPRDKALIPVKGLRMKRLDAVIPGDLLWLKPDYKEFLETLGKHTRRNIRAFSRKVENAGIVFVPQLSKGEYDRAVERLNAETSFPADGLRLARDERLLSLHDGERLGLQGADGKVIAVICGFRNGGRFYVLTQLNDLGYQSLSLSLVLRAHVVNHLIQRGLDSMHFIGGSSLAVGRYCEPQRYRSVFVDRRFGLAAAIKMLGGRLAALIKRFERPVPDWLSALCSGHLDDVSLSERTALRPAAVLSSQRERGPTCAEKGSVFA
jgi:hypothetical protein